MRIEIAALAFLATIALIIGPICADFIVPSCTYTFDETEDLQTIFDDLSPGSVLCFTETTLTLNSELQVDKELTFVGVPGSTIWTRSGNGRLILITTTSRITIYGIIFQDGNVGSDNGGAISNFGTGCNIQIYNCDFYNNQAQSGGAVYTNIHANVHMENCNFVDNGRVNSLASSGTAIRTAGNVTILSSNFTSSVVYQEGAIGTVMVVSGTLNFINSRCLNISGLYSTTCIFVHGAATVLKMSGSTVEHCSGASWAAVTAVSGATAEIEYSNFQGITDSENVIHLSTNTNTYKVSSAHFHDNIVSNVISSAGSVLVEDSLFINNQAASQVRPAGSITLSFERTDFFQNSGAIVASNPNTIFATAHFENCTLEGNNSIFSKAFTDVKFLYIKNSRLENFASYFSLGLLYSTDIADSRVALNRVEFVNNRGELSSENGTFHASADTLRVSMGNSAFSSTDGAAFDFYSQDADIYTYTFQSTGMLYGGQIFSEDYSSLYDFCASCIATDPFLCKAVDEDCEAVIYSTASPSVSGEDDSCCNSSSSFPVAAVVVVIILMLIILLVAVIFILRRREQRRKLHFVPSSDVELRERQSSTEATYSVPMQSNIISNSQTQKGIRSSAGAIQSSYDVPADSLSNFGNMYDETYSSADRTYASTTSSEKTFGKKSEYDIANNVIKLNNTSSTDGYAYAVQSTSTKKSEQNERAEIVFGKELGVGQFGTVVYGTVPSYWLPPDIICSGARVPVAIKQLKSNANEKSKRDFDEEAIMMQKFMHPNIVRVVATFLEIPPHLLVLEFLPHGDLKSLLIKCRKKSPPISLSPHESAYVLQQVASGMSYLSEIRFVHRDLAARNCLVGGNLTVKIADFGLSKRMSQESDYYKMQTKGKLPVKWMAPESFLFKKFSVQSDVWSFGVVMWEVYEYGSPPYPDIEHRDVAKYLEDGNRLPQPINCPAEIYSLMQKCWEWEACDRPSFSALDSSLNGYISLCTEPIRDIGELVNVD